jgi:hypothetical protein
MTTEIYPYSTGEIKILSNVICYFTAVKYFILHNRYVLFQYGINHLSACILFLFTRTENITHSLVRNIISELVNKKPYAHSNIYIYHPLDVYTYWI